MADIKQYAVTSDLHWHREPPTERGVYWAYKPNDTNDWARVNYTVLYWGDYRPEEVKNVANDEWYKISDFTHWYGPFPEADFVPVTDTIPMVIN